MRGSRVTFVACLVLSLGAAQATGAAAAEKEPVTGGIIATPGSPVPAPTQAPAAGAASQSAPPLAAPAPPPVVAKADDTSWGLIARGGYFGLPDAIADQLFTQHPEVDGTIYGGEIRLHGDGGGRGVFSLGFAVDYGETSAYGIWQTDESSAPQAGSGDISMLALTVTGYWNIFPAGLIHPYVGLGLGAGYFKGTIQEDADLVEVETLLPVLHLPIGLALELGEHVQLALEARIINGVAAGGSLQIRF